MSNIQQLISSNGDCLKYRYWTGHSPVVVFLPGYKSDMSGTKATMLSEFCQQAGQACLLLDYSGHGESGGEFIDGTIGRWALDAVEIIKQAVGDEKVILVGSSMGGWIMLLCALQLNTQVGAILGLAAAADFTEELMWSGFSDQQKQELEQRGVIYLPSDYDEPLPVTFAIIEEGRSNLLLNNEIDITCPARFIHGMRDLDVPWEVSMRTLQQIKSDDVQITLLKDGDHRLSNDDQLSMIRQTLAELIKQLS